MDNDLLDRVRHLAKDGVTAEFKMLGKAIVALHDEMGRMREELKEAKAAAAGPPPEKPSWKRPGTVAESASGDEADVAAEEGGDDTPAGPQLPPGLGLFGN